MPKDNMDRREYRRRRRMRNQILAWLTLILLLAALVCGGYFLIRYLQGAKKTAAEKKPETQPRIEAEPSPADEQGKISTPEPMDELLEPTPTEAAVAEDEEDPAVMALLEGMELEQKIDGLFMVSPEAITGVDRATVAGEKTKEALAEYAVSAIIFDEKNIESEEKFRQLIKDIRDMYREDYNRRILCFVNEEGSKLSGKIGSVEAQKSAAELAAEGDDAAVKDAYRAIADVLSDFDLDGDLAPVASVKTSDNCYLKDRVFSDDTDTTDAMVTAAVEGLAEGGRLSCLTAFPGEGEATADPENAAISSERSLDEMRACEFLPFLSGMKAGADMIMVSNITLPSVDGVEGSACLSKELVSSILRQELGYDGVILTSPLDQAACSEKDKAGNAALSAVLAGADMLYFRKQKDLDEARKTLLEAVNDGTLSEERIDESLKRIYTLLVKMD
ncbi:MAG: hypothetical protein IK115_04145 [Lachnospiraceae bacterium]|nr:hypothetical protein [Lachnospiraceae bacterium]